MVEVEAPTITALIAFAIIIASVIIGLISYKMDNGIGAGIIIAGVIVGSFMLITRLAPNLFRNR